MCQGLRLFRSDMGHSGHPKLVIKWCIGPIRLKIPPPLAGRLDRGPRLRSVVSSYSRNVIWCIYRNLLAAADGSIFVKLICLLGLKLSDTVFIIHVR